MVRKRRIRKRTSHVNNWPRLFLQGLGLAAVLGAAYWLAKLAHSSEAVRGTVSSYGYVGVFIVSFISGLNLVVPLPAVAFLPVFVESGLHYFWIALVMSTGMTVADGVAYGLGSLGRKAYAATPGSQRTVRRIESFRRRYRYAPLIVLLLFASLAPLPNELMVVPMGILGYRLRRILPVVFVGNVIFNTLYSAGIIRLFELV